MIKEKATEFFFKSVIQYFIMPKAQQKHHTLSVNAFANAAAMLGFVLWIIATVWHGYFAQPSMMPYMYPSFSFVNPIGAVTLLVVWVVSFYIIGWLLATFYNWNLKR